MFGTMLGTMLPAIEFGGLLNPVSSLEGIGALIGRIYPATHFLTISRGIFSKALDLSDLYASFWAMLLAVPVIFVLSIALLKKQDT
jgi:ribosome-dependent ATPase